MNNLDSTNKLWSELYSLEVNHNREEKNIKARRRAIQALISSYSLSTAFSLVSGLTLKERLSIIKRKLSFFNVKIGSFIIYGRVYPKYSLCLGKILKIPTVDKNVIIFGLGIATPHCSDKFLLRHFTYVKPLFYIGRE